MSLFDRLFVGFFLLLAIHTSSIASSEEQSKQEAQVLPGNLSLFVKDACWRLKLFKIVVGRLYGYRPTEGSDTILCVALKTEQSGWFCVNYKGTFFHSMYGGIGDENLASYCPLVCAAEVVPLVKGRSDTYEYLFR